MENLKILYSDALIPEGRILRTAEKILPEIDRVKDAIAQRYEDDRASVSLLDDEEMLSTVKAIIEEKLSLEPKLLIVIGIGGSNLGTLAVQEAVLGRLYNLSDPPVRVLYADTVDSSLIGNIMRIAERTLRRDDNVILNVISKSGMTTETVANFRILLDLLRKYKKEYKDYVVATCDRDSELWNLAVKDGFATLEIPLKVGGRFSVFSPVGLFPLGLLGVNIEELLAGARLMRETCIGKDLAENHAAIIASIQFIHYEEGKNIADYFFFSSDLESMGKWVRQLIAESLGKEFDRFGRRVNVGITPTVSVGSTDLHSVAQLYLGGPYDKFTTFISIRDSRPSLHVPVSNGYSDLVPGIDGKSLEEILSAILEGTKETFRKDGRPFIEISLPNKSEGSMGQFMQLMMIKTMFLGHLLGVNPFDQPDVEKYKKETRRILAGEKS
jgi:glucose-6-phosphate isomerase